MFFPQVSQEIQKLRSEKVELEQDETVLKVLIDKIKNQINAVQVGTTKTFTLYQFYASKNAALQDCKTHEVKKYIYFKRYIITFLSFIDVLFSDSALCLCCLFLFVFLFVFYCLVLCSQIEQLEIKNREPALSDEYLKELAGITSPPHNPDILDQMVRGNFAIQEEPIQPFW